MRSQVLEEPAIAARLLCQHRHAGPAEPGPELQPEPRSEYGLNPKKDTKMRAALAGEATPQEAPEQQDAFEHGNKPAYQAGSQADPCRSDHESRFQTPLNATRHAESPRRVRRPHAPAHARPPAQSEGPRFTKPAPARRTKCLCAARHAYSLGVETVR